MRIAVDRVVVGWYGGRAWRSVSDGTPLVHISPRSSPARVVPPSKVASDGARKPEAPCILLREFWCKGLHLVPAWYSDGLRDKPSKHNSIPLRKPQVGSLAGCVVRCKWHRKGAANHSPEDERATGAAGDLGTATRNAQPSAPTCLDGPHECGRSPTPQSTGQGQLLPHRRVSCPETVEKATERATSAPTGATAPGKPQCPWQAGQRKGNQ
jgi:hypothetical protein